jgi:hypothetical protein
MREITEHRRSGDYLLHQNSILNVWFERGGYLSLKFLLSSGDDFWRRIGPRERCAACRKSVRCARRIFVGCLLVVVFLAFPRIALVLLFLFTNYLQRAYHGLILPLLGFLLLPLTTLVYAWMVDTRLPITGINLVILIVTVVIDLGGLSGGEYHRRRRWQD